MKLDSSVGQLDEVAFLVLQLEHQHERSRPGNRRARGEFLTAHGRGGRLGGSKSNRTTSITRSRKNLSKYQVAFNSGNIAGLPDYSQSRRSR
jgi:hypothetical protein